MKHSYRLEVTKQNITGAWIQKQPLALEQHVSPLTKHR